MAWARMVRAWTVPQNWSKVVFSDETSFNLNCCNGKVKIWRSRGEVMDPEHLPTQPTGGKSSLMFWGCIGIYGPGELVVVPGRINSDVYINVLQDNLAQSVENIFGDRETFYVFQQDNAPAHTSRATRAWLEENDVMVMNWAPYSPDLNVIENVWGWLLTKLRADPPQTLGELHRRVMQLWSQLPPDYMENLYNSLPRRVESVLERRGYPTKY